MVNLFNTWINFLEISFRLKPGWLDLFYGSVVSEQLLDTDSFNDGFLYEAKKNHRLLKKFMVFRLTQNLAVIRISYLVIVVIYL